jgi:DNA-binding transcriptional MerR regulator
MRINTQEAAKVLGIKPTMLRLLMRQGKIKAPPIVFDSETNSTRRMWSEDDIEQARKVLESLSPSEGQDFH